MRQIRENYRLRKEPSLGKPIEADQSLELKEALGLWEQAQRRADYLADDEDKRRRTYWEGAQQAKAGNASPEDLFRTIHRRLSLTHARMISELPMKRVYPWVDLHADRRPRCLFSGKVLEPEVLIRRDFEICLQRAREIRELAATTMPSAHSIRIKLGRIADELRFHCVELAPNSWIDLTSPLALALRLDLHQRFACEIVAQQVRGDRLFHDCRGLPGSTNLEAGTIFGQVFEPARAESKGVIARAMLYLVVRYPRTLKSSYLESSLKLWLDWHYRYAPSDYEHHRNQAISRIQGNRNPWIDYPEWADRVCFVPA